MKKKNVKRRKNSFKAKASTKHIAEENVETENADENTLVSGSKSGSGNSRPARRKKKLLSRSEKALERLDKQTDKLKEDAVYYDGFVNRMNHWFKEKASLIKDTMKLIDKEGEGFLQVEEFKAGLLHLNVPLTNVELHLLCRQLDVDSMGEIDYVHVDTSLVLLRESREAQRQHVRDRRQLLVTPREFPSCQCCKMSVVEPWLEATPRYLLLELRLITFEKFQDYPCHLKLLVHSHILVRELIQKIITESNICSNKVAVFRNKSRSADQMLESDMTLEECGFNGGSRDQPEEALLFYDYLVEFNTCPILLCDHYFGQMQ